MLRFNFLKLNTNIRSTLRNIKNDYAANDKIILKKESEFYLHKNLVTFDCWNLALDKLKTLYPHIDTNTIAKELPYKNWYQNTYDENYELVFFATNASSYKCQTLFDVKYPILFEEKNQTIYDVSKFLDIIKKQNADRACVHLIFRKLMKEKTMYILLKKDYMNVGLHELNLVSSIGFFFCTLSFCLLGSPMLSGFCFFLPLCWVPFKNFQFQKIILNGIRELKKSA